MGARVRARDEEINSIDKKEKEKRGKKKRLELVIVFVLQEQGCNTCRIFLKAQKVENHGGWGGKQQATLPKSGW